ncbi:Cysteine sulfinic acid decarboxylase [Portunus trituberculatus]|uniref:Cysteine sulfinic acid decarboxylase n=2 Tax=Portuninae TaxID=600346 RepID=A0A5B7I3J2_PORTR|nr:Cysteine sulfinic acid decarboxylase [Portunus trituberculatus]
MVREGRMMITYQPLRGRPNFFRLVLQSSQVTSRDLEYFINTIEELAQNSQE